MSTDKTKMYSGPQEVVIREMFADHLGVFADRLSMSGRTIAHLENVLKRKSKKIACLHNALKDSESRILQLGHDLEVALEQNRQLSSELVEEKSLHRP